jgi:hypothetical protein
MKISKQQSAEWGRALKMQWRQQWQKQTRLWVWAMLGGLMVVLLALLVQPALAAIQLSYFNIISNPTSVILQWGTTSEFNVQGFEVQCKLASEPDTAFHRIGFLPAKGGPSTPAQYTFPVTTGVEPGVPYCFRLLELTTDGTQGEAPTLCGYGPNVTPTPGAPGIVPTLNPNTVPAVPTDAFGNPIVQPPAVATDAFGSPLPQPPAVATDAFGNPIAQPPAVATDAFGNPIAQPPAVATDAFGSPLPQPVMTDVFGNPVNPAAAQPMATDAFGNPLPLTQPPLTDAFGSPLATPTFTPDPFAPPTPIIVTPLPGAPRSDASALAPPQDPALAQPVTEAPAVAYIVVTAAPTEPPVALGAAMTPLPTVTPTPPAYQLVNALAPTTQNLMIMLLCLTFTGASGIGILGLITSMMFMRSRSSRRRPW